MTDTQTGATMGPGVLPNTFDVRCEAHGLDQRGLRYSHAITAKRTHDAEEHQAEQAEATAPEMTSAVMATLERIHPDTFVQAAVWRTFVAAPDLLSIEPRSALQTAVLMDTPL